VHHKQHVNFAEAPTPTRDGPYRLPRRRTKGGRLPHSDSSLEEDVGNTVLFPDPAADTLASRIQAASLRHEAIWTAG
jgi:hypothetical protein